MPTKLRLTILFGIFIIFVTFFKKNTMIVKHMVIWIICWARWRLRVTIQTEISSFTHTFVGIDFIGARAMDTRIFGALIKIHFTIFSSESWNTSASVSTWNIRASSLILTRIGETFIDSFLQFYNFFLDVLYFNLKE